MCTKTSPDNLKIHDPPMYVYHLKMGKEVKQIFAHIQKLKIHATDASSIANQKSQCLKCYGV